LSHAAVTGDIGLTANGRGPKCGGGTAVPVHLSHRCAFKSSTRPGRCRSRAGAAAAAAPQLSLLRRRWGTGAPAASASDARSPRSTVSVANGVPIDGVPVANHDGVPVDGVPVANGDGVPVDGGVPICSAAAAPQATAGYAVWLHAERLRRALTSRVPLAWTGADLATISAATYHSIGCLEHAPPPTYHSIGSWHRQDYSAAVSVA
jgi:hypothetical protein